VWITSAPHWTNAKDKRLFVENLLGCPGLLIDPNNHMDGQISFPQLSTSRV
jgi:hypothetical protein